MSIRLATTFSFAAGLMVMVQNSAFGSDQANNEKWREQETWTQFTDKEQTHTFKMRKPAPPVAAQPPVILESAPRTAEPPSGITGYILDPAPAPVNQTQQMMMMMMMPNPGYDAFMGPGYVPQFYNSRSSHGFGPFFHSTQRYGWTTPMTGQNMPMPNMNSPWVPSTRVIQTGVSKAAGNYYNPSTPDPTASGNYYADPGNAPKLRPIYTPAHSPQDYWGPTGNPFPADAPAEQPR